MSRMVEEYKNYGIEDYKLLGNNYHLKLKNGPELVCKIPGYVFRSEGDRHLEDAVVKSCSVESLGRKIHKGFCVDTKSLNIFTNRGMYRIQYNQRRAVRDKPVEHELPEWRVEN
jgi:hypothetical protein